MKINFNDWVNDKDCRYQCTKPFKIGDRVVATNSHVLISTKQVLGDFEKAKPVLIDKHFDISDMFVGKVLKPLVIQDHYYVRYAEVYEVFGFQFRKEYIDLINQKDVEVAFGNILKHPVLNNYAANLIFKSGDTFGCVAGLYKSPRVNKNFTENVWVIR